MTRPLLTAALWSLSLFWIGAGSVSLAQSTPSPQAHAAEPTAVPAPQVKCPVTTDEDIDPEVFTEYKGKRVYFCCERCKIRFTRDPEKYAIHLASDSPTSHDQSHAGAAPPSAQSQEEGHHHDEPTGHAEDSGHVHADHADHDHAESSDSGHDHAGNADEPRLFRWLGKLHPAATDFPVALLTAAFVAELLFLWRKRAFFDDAGRFCLWGAALSGVGTAFLGWCFGGFHLVDHERLLLIHRWLGTGAALLMVAVLILAERHRRVPGARRGVYSAALTGAALIVLGTAFVGGAMVWGLDHYAF